MSMKMLNILYDNEDSNDMSKKKIDYNDIRSSIKKKNMKRKAVQEKEKKIVRIKKNIKDRISRYI